MLTRCWPRSPWYQARTSTIGRPMRSASTAICRTCCGPVEGLADVLEALQESPGGGDVDQSPLDDLAAAQPGPGALGSTLCRRVGHSAAPMASECSGIRSGCGCEGHARQTQALFTARRGGCLAVSIGCLDKVLRRARSPHQRGATPQRRSPGASASRRAGNLETWDPAARSRTPQVARIPDFQFLAPAATSAGATGGRGSGRGRVRAATWRTGNLEPWESARRGAGRVDAGPPLPGVPAWGALGRRPWPPPWPGGARPGCREGRDFGGCSPECSRTHVPQGIAVRL